MADQPASDLLTLPSGGGALRGLGESFQPDLHTGTGTFTVPLDLPPGRAGFHPRLALAYHSAAGNGPCGIGWAVDIPSIRRRTERRVPRYDGSDVFLLSGAELVPVPGAGPEAQRFRPRAEGLFARIDHVRGEAGDVWDVWSGDGLRSRYGTARPTGAGADWTDPAIVADPSASRRIAGWLLTETRDSCDNRIAYTYVADPEGAQRYIAEIQYLEARGAADAGFLTTIRFRYGSRPDVFTVRRSGFPVTTSLRCVTIETWVGGASPALTRRVSLRYADELGQPPANGASLLARIEVTGIDGEREEALPPLELGYTDWSPERVAPVPLHAPDGLLPDRSLATGDMELVDLFGDGLPSVVELGDGPRYWRNRGEGHLDAPRPMPFVPDGTLDGGAARRLAELDGDGRLELLVNDGTRAGYFPLARDGGFARSGFVSYRSAPALELADPEVRLVDVDGDNVVDLVRTGDRIEQWLNAPPDGWQPGPAAPSLGVSFQDPRLRVADMTGDNLGDLVLVEPRRVRCWPNLGNGQWGEPVDMEGAPAFEDADGLGFDPRRVLLGDLDGDGCAELVCIGPGRITVWPNRCGTGFGEPRVIRGTPDVADPGAVRIADVLGTGTAGLLFTRDLGTGAGSAWWFLDLVAAGKPYLLTAIDNHCGAQTEISYAPSTRFALADARAGRPWRTSLPFPVQVVSSITSTEHFSRTRVDSQFRYHDGYWDPVHREFRGFARVDQHDSRPDADRPGSPPTEARTWFHVGPIGPITGDWDELDPSSEYWPADPSDATTDLTALGAAAPSAVRWEAMRALAGRVLRTELYGLDGRAAADRPYTVTESRYRVAPVLDGRAPDDPGWLEAPVLVAHAVAERTTQWERGSEALTAWTLSGGHDAYGRPAHELAIALPRKGMRAGEPCLTTLTEHRWATRDDDTRYVIDRAARVTRWEVGDDGTRALGDVIAGALDRSHARRLLQLELRFYDGAPFAGLPLGQIGDHGLLTRTERLALTDARLAEIVDGAGSAPDYLAAAPTPWGTDYPDAFRAALATGAGYIRHEADGNYEAGWYVTTGRRRYDIHDDPSGCGLPVVERDPRGRDTVIAYDGDAFLPVALTDPLGLVRTAAYDARTRQPSEIVDVNGNRTRAAYTPLGLLAWVARMGRDGDEQGDTPEQPGLEYAYGHTAWDDSAAGPRQPAWIQTTRRIQHRWDLLRGERERRAAEGSPPPSDDELFGADEHVVHPERFLREQHMFDGAGRALQVRTQFDDAIADAGLQADVAIAPAPASIAAAPDAVIVSGWVEYDDKGRPARRWEAFLDSGWEFAPVTAERLTTLAWTAVSYDARGAMVSERRSDGAERRVVHGVPTAVDDPEHYEPTPWESYAYDANDNAGRTHPVTGGAWSAHWNTPSSTTIDGRGRVIRTVERLDGRELVSGARYDADGRVVEVTDPLGRGRRRAVYDLLGRAWRTELLDAGVAISVHDAAGDVVEQRDAKGALVLIAYDAGRRATRRWARDRTTARVTLREAIVYGDAPDTGLTAAQAGAANVRGRPYRVLDEAGIVGALHYDLAGNLLEKMRRLLRVELLTAGLPSGAGDWSGTQAIDWTPAPGADLLASAETRLEADAHTMSAGFDALGRRTRITLPVDAEGHRRELRFAYARSGALSAVALDGETIVERIWHDARGRRVLARLGSGVLTRYAYDADTGRLVRVHSQRSTAGPDSTWHGIGPGLEDRGYAYDLVGNVLAIRDRTPGAGLPIGPVDALDREFGYDALYRLVSATGREHDVVPPEPWSSAPRGTDLTRVRAYSERYRHDDAGNVLELRHGAAGAASLRTFTLVPGSDRLATLDLAAGAQTYAYDATGNLVGEGPARHFEWDAFDRMVAYRTQLGDAEPSRYAQYRYDPAGGRVLKLVRDQGGALRTTFDFDGLFERLTIHAPGGATVHDRISIGDGMTRIAEQRIGDPVPGDPAPARTFSLADDLGSVHATLDDTGQLLVREEYTPFGETSFGGAVRKRYRFMGCMRDDESGLALHQLRYYAPWLCRWTSCDPAGDADGGGPYTFVRGSPVSRLDANGAQTDADAHQIPSGPVRLPADFTAAVDRIRTAQTWRDRASALGAAVVAEFDSSRISPDFKPAPAGHTEGLVVAYALGFGYHTSHWLVGDQVPEGAVWAEKGQNALALLGVVGRVLRGVRMLNEINEANAGLQAWGKAWDARRATFLQATDEAAAATGRPNALGRTGVSVAERLLKPGMASEVNVGAGRRMDKADPLGPAGMEWEIKLSKPQNIAKSSLVRSQVARDAARASAYGAGREIGWLSWKGMPANRAQQLENAGVVVTDAPALAAELRQPKQSLVEAFLTYIARGR
jgi:RHS repeat-associated protein